MQNKSLRCSIVILTIILFCSSAYASGNTKNDSFSKSKKVLLNQVYSDHRTTFYCGCPFTTDKRIIPSGNFSPTTKYVKRAKRIEWEHVVPAEAFGNSFSEWRDGNSKCITKKGKAFKSRRCAEKINMTYRYMQADLYNLVPANGQVNALRLNYGYSMISGEPRIFGSCDMEIENRKAEPRPEIRGDIARTYFYMDDAYPNRGIISKKNKKLFRAWAKEDPVNAWERERCNRIEKLQGNKNRFVN